jgi:cold shock CspA family protein
MDRGTFKGWTSTGTFGFIKPDDGSRDVFVAKTKMQPCDHLFPGAFVTFTKVDIRSEAAKR